jgi:hypothetical protein
VDVWVMFDDVGVDGMVDGDVWCVFDDWLMICCVMDGVCCDCVDDCCDWLMFDVGRFVR